MAVLPLATGLLNSASARASHIECQPIVQAAPLRYLQQNYMNMRAEQLRHRGAAGRKTADGTIVASPTFSLILQRIDQEGCAMAGNSEEAAEFSLDQIDAESILVRHVAELHRYAFYIERHDGKRVIGEGLILGNTHMTPHEANDFAAAARFFAETVARQRGFID